MGSEKILIIYILLVLKFTYIDHMPLGLVRIVIYKKVGICRRSRFSNDFGEYT